jgi:hypothetical protein
VGFFRKLSRAYRVVDSQTYKDTIRSTETLTSASLRLLADKTAEEQTQITEPVNNLSEKLHDAIDHEIPLVVALTLLTAIRVHHQIVEKHIGKDER